MHLHIILYWKRSLRYFRSGSLIFRQLFEQERKYQSNPRVLSQFSQKKKHLDISWVSRYTLIAIYKFNYLKKSTENIMTSQKISIDFGKLHSKVDPLKMLQGAREIPYIFEHGGEAALLNTCANGVLKNKSTKYNWFLKVPQ